MTLILTHADAPGGRTRSMDSFRYRTARSTARLRIQTVEGLERLRVEDCIQQRYAQRYGALIRDYMPTLVSLELDGEIVAAAGYRSAAQQMLFLERYLDAPIERYLDDPTCDRRHIAEVGQFIAMRAGAGRMLMPLLARHLSESGFRWAITTATRELHHLFLRMGLQPMRLAKADASRLSESERAGWGRYYDHDPIVVADRLPRVVEQLRQP